MFEKKQDHLKYTSVKGKQVVAAFSGTGDRTFIFKKAADTRGHKNVSSATADVTSVKQMLNAERENFMKVVPWKMVQPFSQ